MDISYTMSTTSAYIFLALAGIIAILNIIPYDIIVSVTIEKKEGRK